MKEKLHLTHKGRDSWDRPVYADPDGRLWKDVEPCSDRPANLCSALNNEFDGEPDTSMRHMKRYQGMVVVFVPARDVWR